MECKEKEIDRLKCEIFDLTEQVGQHRMLAERLGEMEGQIKGMQEGQTQNMLSKDLSIR